MSTNKIIVEWLGWELREYRVGYERGYFRNGKVTVWEKDLDFLHDRNQQKWIIDELIKRGYRIEILYTECITSVHIWHCDDQLDILDIFKENDKIDDSVFIEAVKQLIKKETN